MNKANKIDGDVLIELLGWDVCTQILKLMIEAPLHGEMSGFFAAFSSLQTAFD